MVIKSTLIDIVRCGRRLMKELFAEPDFASKPQPSMAEIVEQARREWVNAQN